VELLRSGWDTLKFVSNLVPSPEPTNARQSLDGANSIWVGIFESWDEAVSEADRHNQKSDSQEFGFSTERWLRRQESILIDAKRGKWERYSTLPVVAALTKPKMIIDFGGGSGWTYWALDENTRRLLTKYVIIEIPDSIRSFEDNFSQGEVDYLTSGAFFKNFTHENSLFYANSSLQYVESDQLIRDIAKEKKPKYVLIDDMQVASHDFYSHQRYYSQRIACRFSALNGAKDLLASEGYILTGYWPYPKTYSGHLLPQLEIEGAHGAFNIELCAPMTALYTRVAI
jgi:putative methyltransferase (TIGR04325 family)